MQRNAQRATRGAPARRTLVGEPPLHPRTRTGIGVPRSGVMRYSRGRRRNSRSSPRSWTKTSARMVIPPRRKMITIDSARSTAVI